MKASSKFLAASAITAALTLGSLSEAFSQKPSNDRNDKDLAVGKTARYKAPAAAADGDTAKFIGGGNGYDPVEIRDGNASQALSKAIEGNVMAVWIAYPKGQKVSPHDIAETLAKKLQQQGMKGSEMIFYVQTLDQGGGVSIYIPPGESFRKGVLRNGQAEVTSVLTPLEAVKSVEDIAKEYRKAVATYATKTQPVAGL